MALTILLIAAFATIAAALAQRNHREASSAVQSLPLDRPLDSSSVDYPAVPGASWALTHTRASQARAEFAPFSVAAAMRTWPR